MNLKFSEWARMRLRTEKSRKNEAAIALLASIVESSSDAITSIDLDTVITSWNRGAELMYGYTATEAIGKSVTMLLPPTRIDEEANIVERIREGETVQHYETVRMRKDGSLVDISLSISPIYNRRGHIVGASKIARDISEKKQLEATLLKAHGLAAAGRMSAAIAHEINNPLEAVTNLLYLLHTETLTDDGKQYLKSAESELQRVANIAKTTLAYYKNTATPEPLQLDEMARETIRVFHRKIEDKHITVTLPDNTATIQGFKGEIQQVLSNLISNAIDAVDKNGQIDISIRTGEDSVTLSIHDNEPGIPEALKAKLYEPFFTTKALHLGTGLGLWVCSEITKKHGATMEIDSNMEPDDHWTTFNVKFPSCKSF